ncbi:benzoylformate decarboxylase [Rubrobacter marinus]|uniref:Benzoylformate decarboxylase n=1 Tax=Rubrobacter marinus TaxID=2653852 RepID=A0A6G8Q328_9ACTN|nr:benzoylformate decarboxylase [Rubrobacter marinus]
MPTVREATYDLLRSYGVRTFFGNPGSNELPFLDGFPEDFRYVLGLHEGAAVAMADGYAQASGETVLVNLHSAAGLGNAMGSLVNAKTSRTPLVVTAGQQAREMVPVEALLANVGATRLPEPLVKWSNEPLRPEDVPAAIARACHLAALPPRGPVFVSLPLDDWSAEADGEKLRLLEDRSVTGRAAPEPSVTRALAERLDRARSPVFVVGPDVDEEGAFEDAVKLAERRRMPVWVSPSTSRCPFPTDHACFRGVLPTGIKALSGTLSGHDLILVAGAPVFRYHQYQPGPFLPPGASLVAITNDPDEAARAPMGDAIVADVALALRALVEAVSPSTGPAPEPRQRPAPAPITSPLSAEAVYDALDGVLPPDAVLVNESTSDKAVFWERVTMSRRGSYYFAAAGGLGFGLAAAVGIGLARPQRPVVAVIGDGSAQYSIPALWSAVRYGIPVTFLIMSNGSYDVLEDFGRLLGVTGVPGIELPGLDHVALARGYGMEGRRVESREELVEALKEALASDAPRLVEVPVRRRGEVRA